MIRSARWVVPALVSVAGIWFVCRGVEVRTVLASAADMRSPSLLLLFPLVLGAEYAARTLRWVMLLTPLQRVPWRPFFAVTASGFFLNNVLPFRIGDAARLVWTGQKARLPYSSVLATLVMDRLFDMICVLALTGLVFWGGILWAGSSLRTALVFALLTGVGAGGLLFVAVRPQQVLGWARRIQAPERLCEWIARFLEGSRALADVRRVAAILVLSLGFWAMNVFYIQVLAAQFGINLSWIQTCWLVVAFCLGVALPSAPGYIGTFEAAAVAALQVLGYDKSLSLSFVLILHVSQILTSALWGLPGLFFAGLRVKGLKPRSAATPLNQELNEA